MVRSEMWSDQKFRDLTPAGKLLYNYILTCPTGNLAGYFALEMVQIKTNLCRSERKLAKFNREDEDYFEQQILPALLGEKELWKYDMDTEQVLIPKYLKYNKISGAKQLASIGKAIRTLKLCELHIGFVYAMLKYIGKDAPEYIEAETLDKVKAMCKEQKTEEAIYILNNLYSE